MKYIRPILLFTVLCGLASCKTMVIKTHYDSGGVMEKYQVFKKNQVRNGYYKIFHENGKIALEQHYKRNRLNGDEKAYYENGQLEGSAHVDNDSYNGTFRYYFPDGTLKQEGQHINNEIEGELKTYYTSGELKEVVMFKKSLEDGPFTMYYRNGNTKVQGSFLGGENYHGTIKFFDDDGTLMRQLDCDQGDCMTIWSMTPENHQPKEVKDN